MAKVQTINCQRALIEKPKRCSASGKRGQKDDKRPNPQSHPDQKIFGLCCFCCIHGAPLIELTPVMGASSSPFT
jgi:hypothetical protein